MCYLGQQKVSDSFGDGIWRIATPPTVMDEDRLPAEPATAISMSLVILFFLLINNFFTLSKKQHKCNVSEENKDFQ